MRAEGLGDPIGHGANAFARLLCLMLATCVAVPLPRTGGASFGGLRRGEHEFRDVIAL